MEDEINRLKSEVSRLRGVVERNAGKYKELQGVARRLQRTAAEQRGRIDALEAENRRLRSESPLDSLFRMKR